MDDFNVVSRKRTRRFCYSPEHCIFCQTTFTEAKPCSIINVNIRSLLEACRVHNDEVGQAMLARAGDIERGTLIVKYHWVCWTTYGGT